MNVEQRDDATDYRSERTGEQHEEVRLVATYAAAGSPFRAREGTLESS